MPTTTEPLLRSLEFERGVTQQACKGVVDPSGLIEQALWRAQTLSGQYVTDPMFVVADRDERIGAREEIEDCLNRLLWDCQKHIEDEERKHENEIAIRLIALAYHQIREKD